MHELFWCLFLCGVSGLVCECAYQIELCRCWVWVWSCLVVVWSQSRVWFWFWFWFCMVILVVSEHWSGRSVVNRTRLGTHGLCAWLGTYLRCERLRLSVLPFGVVTSYDLGWVHRFVTVPGIHMLDLWSNILTSLSDVEGWFLFPCMLFVVLGFYVSWLPAGPGCLLLYWVSACGYLPGRVVRTGLSNRISAGMAIWHQ